MRVKGPKSTLVSLIDGVLVIFSEIFEYQLGATSNTIGWRTLLTDKPITSGLRRWEVILETYTSTANITICVCERHQKPNACFGQNNTAKGPVIL